MEDEARAGAQQVTSGIRSARSRGRAPGRVTIPGHGDTMAGEAPIKQAVKWIEDQLLDRPDADRVKLVDDASRRFDLTPLDEEFLYRHLARRGTPTA